MKTIFYLMVFLFLINASKTGYGQNDLKLPYPIIFVHGLVGDDQSWNNVSDFLISQYGLTFGKRMDFCLNADGNNSISVLSSDIKDFTNTNEGNTIIKGDFYTINFDVDNDGNLYDNGILSDQSAIAKQGKAVEVAVNHVLHITEKDKVILVGHSMGGLACREFIRTYFNVV